jgi:hypothetical protein
MSGILQHLMLSFKLGLAIDIDRIGVISLLIPPNPPIKNFATRQEHKGDFLGASSQVRRGFDIDTSSLLRVVLTILRSAQRRTMNDRARLKRSPYLVDRPLVRQIQLSPTKAMDFPIRCPSSSVLDDVLSDQPRCPSNDGNWLHVRPALILLSL